MKKQMMMILGILLFVNLISAGIQFSQTKRDLGNKTISNYMILCYDKEMSAVLPDIKDYVSGDNFYQAYLLYSIYIKKWNNDNPDYMIDYCNMTLKQSTKQTNYTLIYNAYMTQADFDLNNAKYFFLMKDGDCVIAEQKCRYNYYANQSDLDIPAEMQLITPTWECKACQYYEWSLVEKQITKTETINRNVVSVWDYVRKFVLLNFEILLMIWWTLMILLIFVGIGFIFMGIYFMYLYLKHISK